MAKESRPPGTTTISSEVISSTAILTVLGVEGVSHMQTQLISVQDLINRHHQNGGVRVLIENNQVNLDLHVILKPDINIRQISRHIQKEVARSITEMIGMDVGHININIEDINYLE